MPVSDFAFDALVVGAGLAGSAVAHVLAGRGFRVGVLEKRAEPALAASGNPAGLLIPYLTKTATPESRFYAAAWERILNWPLLEEARIGRRGALHLAHKPEIEKRFRQALQRLRQEGLGNKGFPEKSRIKASRKSERNKNDCQGIARHVSKQEASDLAGVDLNFGGLFYPDGGMVAPKRLCSLCLSHKKIKLYRNTQVVEALWLAKEELWKVQSRQGDFWAPFLVLANAHEAKALSIASWLPVYPVRGQIFYLEGEEALKKLRYSLSYDGYISPVLPDGRQILGASFEHWNRDPEVSGEQNEAIYGLAARVLPELHRRRLLVFRNPGRVAFRSTSTDRFPVVGPLADFATLEKGITKDRRLRHQWSLCWPWEQNLPQVYVSLAHASKGLLSVLLSAEIIAGKIEYEIYKKTNIISQKADATKAESEAQAGCPKESLPSDLPPGLTRIETEEAILHALSSTRFLRRRFRKTGGISGLD